MKSYICYKSYVNDTKITLKFYNILNYIKVFYKYHYNIQYLKVHHTTTHKQVQPVFEKKKKKVCCQKLFTAFWSKHCLHISNVNVNSAQKQVSQTSQSAEKSIQSQALPKLMSSSQTDT